MTPLPQIRLRAWDKDASHMVYDFSEGIQGTTLEYVLIQREDLSIAIMREGDGTILPTMLATGQTGRHKKDIWQGDIVKIPLGDSSHVTRQIVWDRDGWKTHLLPKKGDCEHCKGKPTRENLGTWAKMEVIGNIYQNPEYQDPGVPG